MRFEPEAPVADLVRTVSRVAFEVDDLFAEIGGKEILIAPNSPSPGDLIDLRISLLSSLSKRFNQEMSPRYRDYLARKVKAFEQTWAGFNLQETKQ